MSSRPAIVLTGAAGGIGRAIATRLAARGHILALVDRDAEGLALLVRDLPGPKHSIHVADLSELDRLDALVAGITERHAAISVVINNAGLTVHGPLTSYTPAQIDRVLDVDLRAVVHLCHRFLPHLASGGHLINISSMAGMQGFPFQSAYSAAKWGVRGFGQALRAECAGQGIAVTTVLPGTIATGFLAAADTHDAETSERLARLMQRHGTPADRVAAVVERALSTRRAEVRVGWDAHAMAWAVWAMPWLVAWGLALAVKRRLLGAT